MNKKEIIQQVSSKTSINQKYTIKIIDATIKAIIEATASGETVQLAGFGTFEAHVRKERTGKNPLTGEDIKIAASTVPIFRAAKDFKQMVNKL